MGQYYNCVVLKKDWKETNKPVRAALSPYDFNNGAKLMEHSYVHSKYVNAFMFLFMNLIRIDLVYLVFGAVTTLIGLLRKVCL